jgi:hypothetical protein
LLIDFAGVCWRTIITTLGSGTALVVTTAGELIYEPIANLIYDWKLLSSMIGQLVTDLLYDWLVLAETSFYFWASRRARPLSAPPLPCRGNY